MYLSRSINVQIILWLNHWSLVFTRSMISDINKVFKTCDTWLEDKLKSGSGGWNFSMHCVQRSVTFCTIINAAVVWYCIIITVFCNCDCSIKPFSQVVMFTQSPTCFVQVCHFLMIINELRTNLHKSMSFQCTYALGEIKKQTCLASPPASFFEAACFFLFFSLFEKTVKKQEK